MCRTVVRANCTHTCKDFTNLCLRKKIFEAAKLDKKYIFNSK